MHKIKNIKYFLLDMDGTIYLDTTLIDGTMDFLNELEKQNKRAIYITNNSSKAVAQYIEKLQSLNIETTKDDFCTSANALVHNLKKEKEGAKIFLLGTPSLENYIVESGFELVKDYYTEEDKRPDYVVMGFDTTLTYEKLRIACDYINDGVAYVATHPDMVCPVGVGRSIPDAGAFMELIAAATGRRPSMIAGKPNPLIIEMVMEKENCSKDEIAVIGDRLNTDVLCAINAGVMSICVLTGETTKELLETSDVKPDYVFDSIKDVYEIIKE